MQTLSVAIAWLQLRFQTAFFSHPRFLHPQLQAHELRAEAPCGRPLKRKQPDPENVREDIDRGGQGDEGERPAEAGAPSCAVAGAARPSPAELALVPWAPPQEEENDVDFAEDVECCKVVLQHTKRTRPEYRAAYKKLWNRLDRLRRNLASQAEPTPAELHFLVVPGKLLCVERLCVWFRLRGAPERLVQQVHHMVPRLP